MCNKWIDFEKEKPPREKLVLFKTDDNELTVGEMDYPDEQGERVRLGNSTLVWDFAYNIKSAPQIIAWMELPNV